MEQQKAKVEKQLKILRQESVKDYLSEKLNSLASKQVVNDILHQFLTNHDQQFLQNLAGSIATVKFQCKQLKAELKKKQDEQKQFEQKLKNQIKNEYEIKSETLLNEWTFLQIFCQQKLYQRNPRKAIENVTQHLKQVLEKKQILQKSIKQIQEKVTKLQESHEEQLKNIILNCNTKEEKLRIQKQQLKEKIHSQIQTIEKLRYTLLQAQKNNQILSQKFKNAQTQHKQSHQLLQFLQNKVCEIKEDNIRLKFSLQLSTKSKEQSQQFKQKLRSQNEKLKQQSQSFKIQLAEKAQKLKKCELDLKVLQQKYQENQTFSKQQIKKLSEEVIYLRNQNILTKVLHQTQSNGKNQALLKLEQLVKSNQKLNQQLKQFKKLFALKQSSFKSYVLQKDQQIRIVQEQLHILRAQLDQSQERQKQYETYLIQLNELKKKLKTMEPSYQEIDVQIFQKNKSPNHPIIKSKKAKIYYLHKSLKSKAQNLKNQLLEVQQKNKQEIQSFKIYFNKMIQFLLQKANQQKIICSYCQHKSSVQKNIKFKNKESQDEKVSKQMQKTTKFKNQFNYSHQNHQRQNLIHHQKSATTTKWSKNLKNLNQKFKNLDSQNKEYRLHLENILNQTK